MSDTSVRTFTVPNQADGLMRKLAAQAGCSISDIYRLAVREYLERQGHTVDMTVLMGNPILLAQREKQPDGAS